MTTIFLFGPVGSPCALLIHCLFTMGVLLFAALVIAFFSEQTSEAWAMQAIDNAAWAGSNGVDSYKCQCTSCVDSGSNDASQHRLKAVGSFCAGDDCSQSHIFCPSLVQCCSSHCHCHNQRRTACPSSHSYLLFSLLC